MEQIFLRNIESCTLDEQMQVLRIRNQKNVRKHMYTDHIIEPREHIAWIDHVSENNTQKVFVIKYNSEIVGVVSLSDLDLNHKKSDWAFYLDSALRGGLGAAVELFIIDYVFNKLNLEKLNCEVIESNPTVVKMHKKFGFVEEGFRYSNIEKPGGREGVFLLGLTKAKWLAVRDDVLSAYGRVLKKFAINVTSGEKE